MSLNTSALEKPRVDFRSFQIGYEGSHVEGPRGGTMRIRQGDTEFFRDNAKLANFDPANHLYRIYRAREMKCAVPTAILRLQEKGMVTGEKDYIDIAAGPYPLGQDFKVTIEPGTTVIKLTKGLAQQFAVQAVTEDHGLLDHLGNRTLTADQLILASISELERLLADLNEGLKPIGLKLSIATEPLADIALSVFDWSIEHLSLGCASSYAGYGYEPLGLNDYVSKFYTPNSGGKTSVRCGLVADDPANFLLKVQTWPRPRAAKP